jgi:hypothetical protein
MEDSHHLFWSKEQMRRLELLEFRELPCAIWYGDSRIHSLVHIRFHQHGMEPLTPAQVFDLRVRANLAIRRHKDGWCSCVLPRRLVTIDALSLKSLTDAQPPCLGYTVDRDLAQIMRDFYRPVALLGPNLPKLLEERCRSRQCTCPLVMGHNAYRPRGWNHDLPQAA